LKVIKLSQPQCTPCKMVGNLLDDKGINHEEIDITERPDIPAEYGVMSTPVTILLDDDKQEIERVVGFNPVELESLISKL
jgi:thioredoxin 1